MMRQLIAGDYAIEALHLIDVPAAQIGHDEVRISVRAAAINPSDLKTLSGNFRRDPEKLPLRLGTEVSGVIAEVGDNVTGLRLDDHVIAFRVSGGFADEVVVSSDAVFLKPAQLEWSEASGLLLAGTTAWFLLQATQVRRGETVIVFGGSGGVGSLAVELALHRGATVVCTASAARLAEAGRSGATAVVEYGPAMVGRLQALLPDGADAALDTTGADESLDAAVEIVSDLDRIATIAGYARGAELGVQRLGFAPGANPGISVRDGARQRLIDLAAEGAVHVRVGRSFPLDQAQAAFRAVAEGRTGGKVVLLPELTQKSEIR